MIDTFAVYMRDIAHDLLSAANEIALGRAARAGDIEARAALVRHNLRLVIPIAAKLQGRGLPLEDLIAEGNTGLMRAAKKFDPDRACRFSTVATWWIRQAIHRALIERGGRLIRAPSWVAEARRKLEKGAVPRSVAALVRAADATRITFSLDVPPPGEGRNARYDTPGPDVGPLVGIVDREDLERALVAIGELPDREAHILRRRFGLGCEAATLLEIGREVGLTRERVRQLVTSTLAVLRRRLEAAA